MSSISPLRCLQRRQVSSDGSPTSAPNSRNNDKPFEYYLNAAFDENHNYYNVNVSSIALDGTTEYSHELDKMNKENMQATPTSVAAAPVIFNNDLIYADLPNESLFKLLEDLNWQQAMQRLKLKPQESKKFVSKQDKESFFRRLAIHEACIRQPPAKIIKSLLVAFPDSASAQDNNWRTPLHHACCHDAHTDIIYLLLHACPDAVHVRDLWGYTPIDCLNNASHNSLNKDEVLEILVNCSKDDISDKAIEISKRVSSFNLLSQPVEIENDNDNYLNFVDLDESLDSNPGCMLLPKIAVQELKDNLKHTKELLAQAQNDILAANYREQKNQEDLVSCQNRIVSMQNEFALERDAFYNEITELSQRNSDLRYLLDKMESQLRSGSDSNNKKETASITASTSLTAKSTAEKDTKAKKDIKKYTDTIITLTAQLKSLQSKHDALKQNTFEKDEQITSMTEELRQLNIENEQNKINLEEALISRDNTAMELEYTIASRNEIQNELEYAIASRDEIQNSSYDMYQVKRIIDNNSNDLIAKYQSIIAGYEEDLEESKMVMQRLKVEKDDAIKKIRSNEEFESKLVKTRDELKEMHDKYIAMNEKYVNKCKDYEDLKDKLQVMSQSKELTEQQKKHMESKLNKLSAEADMYWDKLNKITSSKAILDELSPDEQEMLRQALSQSNY